MQQHRLAHIALWIMAALVVAVTAFGPTAATAHPSREHRRQVAIVAASGEAVTSDLAILLSPSSHDQDKIVSRAAQSTHFAASDTRDEHSICGDACCFGFGCCSSVLLTAPGCLTPARVGMAARLPLPRGLASDGVDPVAQLRPPRPFA